MQLFTKSVIISKKNDESRAEMEQALKLVTKIDELRKTLLYEQKKLSEFRTSAKETLDGELAELQRGVNTLRMEIQTLEAEREELKKPLTEQWAQLDKEREDWLTRCTELEEEKATVLLEHRLLQGKMDEADENIDASNELKQEASVILLKAKLERNNANVLTSSLEKDIARFNESASMKEATLTERERRVTIREKELEFKRQNLNEDERNYAISRRQQQRSGQGGLPK